MKSRVLMAIVLISFPFSIYSQAAPTSKDAKVSKYLKATPELLKNGKAVYLKSCAECHGESGDGKGDTAQYMDKKPTNFISDRFKQGDTAEAVSKTILNGIPDAQMPAFADMSEKDRWSAAYYVLSLRNKK